MAKTANGFDFDLFGLVFIIDLLSLRYEGNLYLCDALCWYYRKDNQQMPAKNTLTDKKKVCSHGIFIRSVFALFYIYFF